MTGLQREVLNILCEHSTACRRTFVDYGIYHPAARILELRRMGYEITLRRCDRHQHARRMDAYVLGEGRGL